MDTRVKEILEKVKRKQATPAEISEALRLVGVGNPAKMNEHWRILIAQVDAVGQLLMVSNSAQIPQDVLLKAVVCVFMVNIDATLNVELSDEQMDGLHEVVFVAIREKISGMARMLSNLAEIKKEQNDKGRTTSKG